MKSMTLIFVAALLSAPAFAAKVTIHWSVAHDPGNTRVLDSVIAFGNEVKKESNGEIEVVLEHFRNTEQNLHALATSRVYRGELEMSQVSTASLERFSSQIPVVNMPFLFRDHAHAAKVLDGPVGKELMESVHQGSNGKLRGFAFTYSGGYRQIYGSREIHKVEDLRDFRLPEPGNKMGWELMDLVGARFVGDMGLSKPLVVEALRNGSIDGEEGEYNRLGTIQKLFGDSGRVGVVNETRHSLFLTMIVINEKFYQSLSKKNRDIIARAARQMAFAEREISIQQEAGNKETLLATGVKVVKLSSEENKRFESFVQPIYKKYQATLGSLVRRIKATK